MVVSRIAWAQAYPTRPVRLIDAGEIERAVAAFAHASNGGLVVTTSALSVVHRDLIIALAARHKLPAVYYRRLFVTSGGLISYGPDIVDQHHRAAGYVDRILRGEKPGNLPVQAPTKYELVINLKTAKALGLEVPQTLLGGAAAAWPLAAGAQQPAKLPLIGVLVSASPPHPFADAFWRGLRALGYSEGRNIPP
jgi:putative tryptophan/tyrosine transport system substrate-binding protein